ncbi:MAG: hypothetical protein WEA36_07015 [Balneolaceae bacterium]
MTIKTILSATFSLLMLLGCSNVQKDVTNLPERTIEVVVSDSEVITLDGKELHVSFFEQMLEELNNSYDLTVDIDIQPDAITGVVFDVSHTVHRQNLMLATTTNLDR